MVHIRLLPFALVLALAGCDITTCGNRPLTSATAPDGRRAAAVFVRDCGATTGFSTQVSLVAPGETPADGGNLFVAEGEGRVVSVEWLSPDRLLITYRAGSRLFRREGERDGVRIEYREVGGR